MIPKFLTPEGLEHLANHKYKGGEYTKLDNLMNVFWYKLLDFLPPYLAPNMITLIGFIGVVLSTILLYFSGRFEDPKPTWVILFTVFTQFVYQTMDALDGKQARKINLSTPMGALFDHGIDCLCLAFLNYHSMHFLYLEQGSILFIMITILNYYSFYGSHFIEYFTGVLITSKNNFGVTEA